MTLNEISTDCGSLVQRDKIIEGATGITDKDIICIKWLFIDFDPVRRSGISSSNDELNEAKKLATVVYTYLKNIGFEAPIVAMSGNGYHLLYKLNKLENNKENVSLIKRVLEALAYRFSTDDVKIDVVNFNGSRLCKLWGTLAQKGANTSERPHRMSRIEYIPNEIKATPIELLHKVIDDNTISEANDAPKRKKQVNDTQQAHRKSPVNSNSDFDFARLLKDNNITIQQILRKDDGDYYIDNPNIVAVMKHILMRGHNVGLHPEYNSYDNEFLIKDNVCRLRKVLSDNNLDDSSFGARQHYLRWSPDTWQYYENSGIKFDATLSFADSIGFRCGICYDYPVYNLKERKRLKLREYPLIAMEGTALVYMGLSFMEAAERIINLKKICKKYNGNFVFLWHNDMFLDSKMRQLYGEILNG